MLRLLNLIIIIKLLLLLRLLFLHFLRLIDDHGHAEGEVLDAAVAPHRLPRVLGDGVLDELLAQPREALFIPAIDLIGQKEPVCGHNNKTLFETPAC